MTRLKQPANSPDRFLCRGCLGLINDVSSLFLWAGFTVLAQQDEHIVCIDQSVTIKIGVVVRRVPGADQFQNIIDVNGTIAIHVAQTIRLAGVLDGVAFAIDVGAFNVLRRVAAEFTVGDEGIVLKRIDAATGAGRVGREGAVGDHGAAADSTEQSATTNERVVVPDGAAIELGIACIAVNTSAVTEVAIRDVVVNETVGDQRTAVDEIDSGTICSCPVAVESRSGDGWCARCREETAAIDVGIIAAERTVEDGDIALIAIQASAGFALIADQLAVGQRSIAVEGQYAATVLAADVAGDYAVREFHIAERQANATSIRCGVAG